MSEVMETGRSEFSIELLNSDQMNALDQAVNMVGFDLNMITSWRDAELEYGDETESVAEFDALFDQLKDAHDGNEMKRISKEIAAILR